MICRDTHFQGGPQRFTLLVALLASATAATTHGQTAVSFQQGVDGYAGTLDVFIGGDNSGIGSFSNLWGADLSEQFLDGRYSDLFFNDTNDDDKQLLIRFDDIFGNGPGQIPFGSKVIDAKFVITTGESSSNARTGGPYGVAQLLVPFDEFTTWDSISGGIGLEGGATFEGGQTGRPLDQGFRGAIEAATPATAQVTPIVQNWADGQANQGFVVRAGTSDGWQIFTTGVSLPSVRPKLEVSYEPASEPPPTTVTLQEGTSGYFGTTMAWLQDDDLTEDGAFLSEEFLDGPPLISGDSPDDQALIKFDNIFASSGGPVPDDALITDAQLVIDTASAFRSQNVGTNGNYGVHQMLVDWDVFSVYSDFGGNGPDESDGEVAPPTDLTGAMIADARAHLDVTETLRAWQAGEPNFGFNIQATDTTDGWAIQWLASLSPPQLQISFTDRPPLSPGDFDEDGDVDEDDYAIWQANFGRQGVTPNDGTDFLVWQSGFGETTAVAAAVPEPTTLWLAALAAVALSARRFTASLPLEDGG